MNNQRRLYKTKENAMIGGVCAGISEYFNFDVSIVRLIFLLLLFGGGSGFLIYLVCWIVFPDKYSNMNNMNNNYNPNINQNMNNNYNSNINQNMNNNYNPNMDQNMNNNYNSNMDPNMNYNENPNIYQDMNNNNNNSNVRPYDERFGNNSNMNNENKNN